MTTTYYYKIWQTGEFRVPNGNPKTSSDEKQAIWKDPSINSALDLSHILSLTATSVLFSEESDPLGDFLFRKIYSLYRCQAFIRLQSSSVLLTGEVNQVACPFTCNVKSHLNDAIFSHFLPEPTLVLGVPSNLQALAAGKIRGGIVKSSI